MEKRIKEYEDFIKKRMKNPSKELVAYHREMLQNFQHERLVHLLIMIFFVALTLAITSVCMTTMCIVQMKYWLEFLPLMIATVIMWVLSICYVKHYYFLENHVQALYDVSRKLYEELDDKGIDLKTVGMEVGQKIMKKVEKFIGKEK